ncbi:MFS transporter [Blautia producta]|uniref:MFS transporter n=1 Tax=Blautia producta TaxID=33035 RepID=UPI0031B5C75F
MGKNEGTPGGSTMDAKISIWEKLSYAGGDAACNIVFGLTTTLLTLFYTDYIGISAATVGMIMLISRVFDGVSDMMMGVITERVHSRHGKARPWILWMAVPYALSGVALFTIPAGAGEWVKTIYIFVTYNLVTTVVYTALNLPYGALASLMTRNQNQRAVTNVLRMAISPLGRVAATSLTLPLVGMFGNDQRAWIITTSIFSAVALILLLLCFFNTKERVHIAAAEKVKVPVIDGILALFKNKYWIMCLALWGLLSVHATVMGIDLAYYCKYILGNQDLTGMIYAAEQVMMIAGILVLPALIPKFGKRNLALAGSLFVIAASLILLVNPGEYTIVLAVSGLRGIGEAPLFGVIFSLIADSVEYGQYKTHIRQEGMIFSAASVGSKLGAGLSSAAVTGILGAMGYVSSSSGSVSQPDSAVSAISVMYIYSPIVVWSAAAVLLLFYKLDKQYPEIMKALAEREARGEL